MICKNLHYKRLKFNFCCITTMSVVLYKHNIRTNVFRSSFLIVWVFFLIPNVHTAGKVSCFYNSSAYWREGLLQKFTHKDLVTAMPYCTHLIYMFAGIDEHSYKARSLDPYLDTDSGLNYFRKISMHKSHNPSIKMLLSVGGFQHTEPRPYFKVLETNRSRGIFTKSLVAMVVQNRFDGVDLAWPFPTYEGEKNESVHDTSVDSAKEHKSTFGYLVEELGAEFKSRKLLLTLTVLPYAKADEFIDFDAIKNCVEHIHLMTYDYKTPFRNPNEADYAAPLYYVKNRNENRNVEQTVNWWIEQNVPGKLLIAIPTFGRSWRIHNGWRMKPPVKADGPSKDCLYVFEAGISPYYEICRFKTRVPREHLKVKKVTDNKHHFGTYAYRREGVDEGLWVSYEEPKTAAEKAKFANRLHLGGVAIVDLTLDDYCANCVDDDSYPYRKYHEHWPYEYPILRAAKKNLAV